MMIKKTIAAVVVAGGMFAGTAGVAAAGHDHFIEREHKGETYCRYIAEGQTSQTSGAGAHKFHENVHMGTPGTDGKGTTFNKAHHQEQYVGYEDDCDYVYEKGDKDARQNPAY